MTESPRLSAPRDRPTKGRWAQLMAPKSKHPTLRIVPERLRDRKHHGRRRFRNCTTGGADPVLAAQSGHRHPILGLTQHRHDLRLGETALPHSKFFGSRREKTLQSRTLNQGED